jgi:hypothetical protein
MIPWTNDEAGRGASEKARFRGRKVLWQRASDGRWYGTWNGTWRHEKRSAPKKDGRKRPEAGFGRAS